MFGEPRQLYSHEYLMKPAVKSAERACTRVSPARLGTGPVAAALDELCGGVGLTCPELDVFGDALGDALVDELAGANLVGCPAADLDG